jgi:hypothetical protein
MAQKYVCAHCGVALTLIQGRTWRHDPGPGRRGCPKPSPIPKERWEQALRELAP